MGTQLHSVHHRVDGREKGGKTDTAVPYIQLDTMRLHIRTTVGLGCTSPTALCAPGTPSAA
jgi:hypothetical protein